MSCLRAPGEKTTQDVTVTSWVRNKSFHGSTQTAIKDEVSMGLTSARSDCAVSGVVIRIVLHSPTPYRNQRGELRVCRQRVRHSTKRNMAGTTLPEQPTTIASFPCDDMWVLADIRLRS